MNKKLLVAAVGMAFAGLAQAQTSVVLYGKVDEAIQFTNSPNGRVSRLVGSESGTRWGIRGTEALGDGLSANFQLESGFNGDDGSGQGALFSRISTVGLKGGFGAVDLGRKDTPLFNVLDMADPFGSSYTSSMNYTLWLSSNGRGYTRRASNQVAYTSPNWAGFYFQGMYSFGENNTLLGTTKTLGNIYGLSAIYANGPAYVGLAYNNTKEAAVGSGALFSGAPYTSTTSNRYTALAGSYDFSAVKLYGAFYKQKRDLTTLTSLIDQTVYWLGATIPVGTMSSIGLQAGRVNDRTVANLDARQFGIGYFYNLSKRTTLYSTYGHITNDGASAAVTGFSNGGATNATSLNASGKASSLDFGIVHRF